MGDRLLRPALGCGRRSSIRRATMLKKAYRLKSPMRIAQVRDEGSAWANRWVVLVKAHGQLSTSRFAFAVGKRIGKAVRRNRVKRMLREAVRRRLSEIKPGWDVLIIARQPVGEAGWAQVEWAIADVLRRAQLLCGQDLSPRHGLPGEQKLDTP